MAARVSLDSGSYQYGGVTATDSQVAQLSYDTVSGVRTAEWRVYCISTFALPSGWTDLGDDVYGYDGITPPPMTLTPWGKWLVLLTLIGNDGTRTNDTTLALKVLSGNSFEAICNLEETQFGGWPEVLTRNITQFESAVGAGIAVPPVDYKVPFASSSALAWSSTVLMGGTWIGLGAVASQPDSGSLRLAHGSNITTPGGAGGSIDLFFASLDVAQVDLYVGTGSLRHHYVRAGTDVRFVINAVDIAGFTSAGLDLGGHQLSDFTIDALDLTGIDVQTSSGSIETLERGVAALDAGADGAPVAVVAYTVPVGYKATLRCWVCGETNSTQVPAFDTQWIIKCYRKTGGNVTQYAAAVTPNDEADPTTASVAVTYGLSGGVVTLYKTNTSGTAMRFSGQIVVSLDALVGAGA